MSENNGNRPTVVLVEDYDDNRAMMRTWLEVGGFEVVEVKDGVEAIKAVMSHRPDLVLMDLGLPKMDGLEATRRIREILDHSELPIVAITAYASEDYTAAALLAGCNECFTKPVNLDRLGTTVRELSRHSNSENLA